MEIKEIFSAQPYSVFELFIEPGLGLYVPNYQRPYSWDKEKIERLLDDVAAGLEQLLVTDDSIKFLGSIITLKDNDQSTIQPQFKEHLPPSVVHIIDGQQRLSTLLVLATVLHESISTRLAKVKPTSSASAWLKSRAEILMAELEEIFSLDMRTGELRYYPRMIRAYVDGWSRHSSQAQYKSPIASLLFQYGSHSRANTNLKAKFDTKMVLKDMGPAHENDANHLLALREHMFKHLRTLLKNNDDTRIVGVDEVVKSQHMQIALFQSEMDDSTTAGVITEKVDAELLSLMAYAAYFMKRVTVTRVTAKREQYGFDMFEALNTTGEPLTVLETFKPKVILAEKVNEWPQSVSKSYFEEIESYIGQKSGSVERQKRTSKLVIPFALAQQGQKLGTRVSEQRRFLHQSYEETPEIGAKREYLALLSSVSQIHGRYWTDGKVQWRYSTADSGHADLGLAFLSTANHEIVIPLLSRYHAAVRFAEDKEEAEHALALAIKACAGFFALYRAASIGTNNIDSVWREVMGSSTFSLKNSSITDVPDISELQTILQSKLEALGVLARHSWISQASHVPTYSASKPLTRFLLLAASNNAVCDAAAPGLLRKAKNGVHEVFNKSAWMSNHFKTIEHVYPQKADGTTWASGLSENRLVDCIGNLTLLPGELNSSLSNKPWSAKRVMYKALSAETKEEAASILEAVALNEAEKQSLTAIAAQGNTFLPMLKSVGAVDIDWTPDFVQLRSENLLSLAHDSIASWVGLEVEE
ncbi:uncharacterized protein DUF1524 [Arthrobacter sp. SLBN-83]|uniref:DUF262 domain-containing protein n=1 Tax=Arthrobacter sp. SLBN-83 TaxID=2768449 RepID=UPI0011508209|nr:DUF262 domain-containing HNH endonuclease family protein [Arthrobacter sp. SLBN-83]TQJ58038.1 uncharacterized protein DUF1524 [Arthrobacter sp. SLBN-83]